MALSADTPRSYGSGGNRVDRAVVTNVIIYRGAFCSRRSSGYVGKLVAGEPFEGIAEVAVDSTSIASGLRSVHLIQRGTLKDVAVTGVDGVDDIGKPVYASDDGTLTLTATGNSYVGRVERWSVSTTCDVEFKVTDPSAAIADATDAGSVITRANLIIDALEKVGIIVPS